MVEKYNKLKSKYKEYVVFIKRGCFYEVYDIDAIIIRNIFGYKVRVVDNSMCCGIYEKYINRVLSKLTRFYINYIIYIDDVTDVSKFKKNCYSTYF